MRTNNRHQFWNQETSVFIMKHYQILSKGKTTHQCAFIFTYISITVKFLRETKGQCSKIDFNCWEGINEMFPLWGSGEISCVSCWLFMKEATYCVSNITTAPNKPKVGVSEGIQNKHCVPQRHPAYFKKQSKKKTSWRQPAEHQGPSPSLLFSVDMWHQGWCF